MAEFEAYKNRKIEFLGAQTVTGWSVKVYTITLYESFQSSNALTSVLKNLNSDFISQAVQSELTIHRHAFVVVHEAREGVWVLFSWWTGGEMLQTIVRFIAYDQPTVIKPSPYPGSLICTWELEVYIHERQAWIEHVLKRPQEPDFMGYIQNGLL